jgi:hypothetical protein
LTTRRSSTHQIFIGGRDINQHHLKRRWEFGEEPEDEAVGDIDPDSIVNVINKRGGIVLRPAIEREADAGEEAEEA